MKTREQRFRERVVKGGPRECWPWAGFISPTTGYGVVQWEPRATGKSTEHAHRIAYRLDVGPIPDGAHVMHLCNNKPCCNPAHLRAGTGAENSAMAAKDGLYRRGSRIGWAKLTEDVVRQLRAADLSRYGAKKEICERYGIGRATLHRALTGKNWKHTT